MRKLEACEMCPRSNSYARSEECHQLIIAGRCGKWMVGEMRSRGLDIISRDSADVAASPTQPVEVVPVGEEFL